METPLLNAVSQELHSILTEGTFFCLYSHQGLYQFTMLPFGVASAPAIFQWTMDTILQGLSCVICYIDDILVTGASEEEHLHNLEEVLK